jgi:hypothetical protein
MIMNEAQKIAESVLAVHKFVAYADDRAISSGNSPVYQASQRLLLASIRTAYGLSAVKALRVYDLLIDNGENVAYNVDLLTKI